MSETAKRELTGAETLMGFLGWLTSRDQPVTFSATHDASLAIELMDRFTAANDIGFIGEDWPDCYTRPEPIATTNAENEGFKAQLERLINHNNLERGSNTPDFLLADYLVQCLAVFDVTMEHRDRWYGHAPPGEIPL